MTPPRIRFALVGLGIALALGLAELGLRLVARLDVPLARELRERDPFASSVELFGASCFRALPSTTIRYPNGTAAHVNRLGYRGPEVAMPKPAGTRRIVLLGGSTTHGCLVDDDQTIDARLRHLLAAAGAPAEVVNLGLDGLDARCDLERLRGEGLAHAPDVVVLHTGVNDVLALRFDTLAPNDPARGFRAELRVAEERRAATRGPWAALKHVLYVARVPGLVRTLAASPARVVPGPPEPSPIALAAFADIVRAIATSVPATTLVVLSTPPTRALGAGELARCGPVVGDAATTLRYRVALAAALRDVAIELAADGRAIRYVAHTLPDAELLDECHPTPDGNRRIAADLARIVLPTIRAAK